MPNLLTPDDCAERLAVTAKVVRLWLRDGKLKGIRFGRLWRVHPTELARFLGKGFAGVGRPKARRKASPRRKPRKGSKRA